jgi:hypothetical protein
MSKEKIVHIDEAGAMIADLQKMYDEGKTEDLVIGVLDKDNGINSWWTTDTPFLTRLGMAENLKDVIQLEAQGFFKDQYTEEG